MAPTTAPAQHKQPSRKGKKAWRKNIDITDVQEGLDDVRQEIIAVGGILADKPSSELFVVDADGSADIRKEYLKKHKPLKADEILSQRSAVPALDSRKRSSSRVTDGVKEPATKKRREGVSHKEYDKLRQLAYGGDAVEKNVIKSDVPITQDLWGAPAEPVAEETVYTFLEKKKPIVEPKTLKHAPISLAASGKPVAAVRKPQAGKSYNPTFEDWDAILTREGDKEVAAEKKRLQEEEEERIRQERIAASAAEADREASEDHETDWESEWEGFQSGAEDGGAAALKKKRPERKTPAQRNKIKRRKEAERLLKHESRSRAKEEQMAHIKALAKAVQEAGGNPNVGDLVNLNDESSDADEDDEEIELRRRKLGKTAIPKPNLEVVLADELADSLRRLKPEGNLLDDRFRSMLIRGKVETRKPVWQKKKGRTMVTEKWSYKDWKLR